MIIVIIGGGPSGMIAASTAAKLYKENMEKAKEPSQIILIEKNEKLGKKLFITGKGRCNLTNACENEIFFKNVIRNSKFMYSSFTNFSNIDLMNLIEENGCKLKVERGNRVFPVGDKSYDIIDAFKNLLKKYKVDVKLNTEVKRISIYNDNDNNVKFEICTNNKLKIIADKVLISTGGLSYPSTGSTGDGYSFAKNFGLNVTKCIPALVPYNIKEISECKKLQGLTLKNVSLRIFDENKVLYEDFGEMLFTHFGLSGPLILSSSSYIDNEKNKIISIDLKPALTYDQIDKKLLRYFDEYHSKNIKSIIKLLLPNSLVDVFIERLDFNNVLDLSVSDIDKNMRKKIVNLIKDFRFTIVDRRDFTEAIITRGGVDIKEINPKTMESKKIKNLYFSGEVLDVDGLTGGFNIQIACSTGFTAGKYLYGI